MTSDCEEENNKEKDYCEKDENGENNLIGEQLDTSKSNIDGGQKSEENEKQVRALLRNDSDYECDLLFRKRIRRRESRKPMLMLMTEMKKEGQRRTAMKVKQIQTRDRLLRRSNQYVTVDSGRVLHLIFPRRSATM